MLLFLLQRASVSSGHSIPAFLQRIGRELSRVAGFGAAATVLVWILQALARGHTPLADIADVLLTGGLFAVAGIFILFLARQFAAPPWWRLNAWTPALDEWYTGSLKHIGGWILGDARAFLADLRPLDRTIILAGMPALAWDLSRIVGPNRALVLTMGVLLIAYLALGVAVLTANRIPRTLMTQLQDLRNVARSIASGDLSARAQQTDTGDYEELAELVRDLNSMARALQAREGENAVLHHQLQATLTQEQDRATRDGLTGLRNNRYFHEALAAELQRCARTNDVVTIGLLDLDNFKQVNDTFGHKEGDAVLVRMAYALGQTVRPYDLACRLGGEEFGVIFPSTSPEEAKVILDRIATALGSAGPQGSPQTFSGGVATFPHDAQDLHELYQKADAASYTAKSKGKGRTVIFDSKRVAAMNSSEHADQREREQLLATARSLVQSVDARESMARNHSELVGRYSAAIARALGFDEEFAHSMYLCGLLHDVGKIGIDESIVRKPGRLSEAEYAEIQRHPDLGHKIVSNAGFGDIARWVRHHHEHWDGTGYPHGLFREQIPLGSRIVLVSEAFEVLTSDRAYRRAMNSAQALDELVRSAGTRFDPAVVEAIVYLVRSDLLVPGAGSRVPLEAIPPARPDKAPPLEIPAEALENTPAPAPRTIAQQPSAPAAQPPPPPPRSSERLTRPDFGVPGEPMSGPGLPGHDTAA